MPWYQPSGARSMVIAYMPDAKHSGMNVHCCSQLPFTVLLLILTWFLSELTFIFIFKFVFGQTYWLSLMRWALQLLACVEFSQGIQCSVLINKANCTKQQKLLSSSFSFLHILMALPFLGQLHGCLTFFTAAARRALVVIMLKCVSVILSFCHVTFSRPLIGQKSYRRGGHWGPLARQRQHICCIRKARQIRKGWAELCHTQKWTKPKNVPPPKFTYSGCICRFVPFFLSIFGHFEFVSSKLLEFLGRVNASMHGNFWQTGWPANWPA